MRSIRLGLLTGLTASAFIGVPAAPSGRDGMQSNAHALEARLAGRLVFSAEGDIWTMAVDGSDRTRLTTDPAEDFDPSWSPDGTRIAFRSHRDDNEEVYVMAADGSEQRNLSHNPTSDYSPAWSPDGTTIAFASDRDGDLNEIYLMDADGSNQRRLTDNPGIDEYPTWSPDGTEIAFHCTMGGVNPNGTGDFEICVINRDGTDLQRITDTPGENTQPTWSPDGQWIAFESNRLGWPSLPTVTPDGYDHESFGDEDVWVMHPDGSQQHNVTSNPQEDDSFPAWSPDGSSIASHGTDNSTRSLSTAPNIDRSPTAQGPTTSRTGSPSPEFEMLAARVARARERQL